jgi:hypothetical protein
MDVKRFSGPSPVRAQVFGFSVHIRVSRLLLRLDRPVHGEDQVESQLAFSAPSATGVKRIKPSLCLGEIGITVTIDGRPDLDSTRISSPGSRAHNPRLTALRPTARSDHPSSGNTTTADRPPFHPAVAQIADATCRARPGKRQALTHQGHGIGPRSLRRSGSCSTSHTCTRSLLPARDA